MLRTSWVRDQDILMLKYNFKIKNTILRCPEKKCRFMMLNFFVLRISAFKISSTILQSIEVLFSSISWQRQIEHCSSKQSSNLIHLMISNFFDMGPYSPDLASSCYYLFRSMTYFLNGGRLDNEEEVENGCREYSVSKDQESIGIDRIEWLNYTPKYSWRFKGSFKSRI